MQLGVLLTVLMTLVALPLFADPTIDTASPGDMQALQIEDAYAYPPIGAGNVGIAFMRLQNESNTPIDITAASSPLFERVELHNHLHEDGVMKMREVDQVRIEPGQTVSLEPGGLHIMLMGAKEAVTPGMTIPLTLELGPNSQPIDIPVKARR